MVDYVSQPMDAKEHENRCDKDRKFVSFHTVLTMAMKPDPHARDTARVLKTVVTDY